MNLEISDLLDGYKTKLAEATHENVLLTAQVKSYERIVAELESRVSKIEKADSSDAQENVSDAPVEE